MFKEQPHGIGSLAHQTEVLVDDVEMVERVVIADLNQVRTASPDHAIRLTSLFRERASNFRQVRFDDNQPRMARNCP